IGYSAADFEHGPVVLARDGTPVLFMQSPGLMGVRTRPLRQRLIDSGCDVWTVATERTSPSDRTLSLPGGVTDELSPILMVLPGLILAEHAARILGYDPDAPRGLTKVTETL
ncbi:MAG TPA: glucosamine-6-phosphate deaminase, partial [Acidimicrobiia bacterium]|nr:glucosamine-6-phosphate deaminase [Acidimicrobiia bacterium]